MFFVWNIQLVKNYGGFFCTYKDFLSPTQTDMQLVWIPFILWQKWWFWIRRTLKNMAVDLHGSQSEK